MEKKRREAQNMYLAEQKYIQENKEEFERMIAADIEAQQKQMGGSVLGSLGVMTGLTPPPKKEDMVPTGAQPTDVGKAA